MLRCCLYFLEEDSEVQSGDVVLLPRGESPLFENLKRGSFPVRCLEAN